MSGRATASARNQARNQTSGPAGGRPAPRQPEEPARLAPVPRHRVVAMMLAASALLLTGAAWKYENSVQDGFQWGGSIFGPKSTEGTNILLIGLDSRKDQNGEDLPDEVLDQLHAGDGSEGGYNTNTLILVHIPEVSGKAVAFSIPRDDYVAVKGISGYTKAKIKEAYGLKKFQTEKELVAQGVSDRKTIERKGREAGRQETIQTVRDLLDVPIDQYAEVNLAGFYDVAKALGGVDVCLNNAVQDDEYSGADFPAGPQHLDPAQALAFVRQRHGLDNGDLDRTHRQQAFLAAVEHKLTGQGVFSDLDTLRSLVAVAQKDVVLSPRWDVVAAAQKIQQITGGQVEFKTLPVERYDMVDGQDVNVIDPAKVKAQVQHMFYGTPLPQTSAAATAGPSSSAQGGAAQGAGAEQADEDQNRDPDVPDQGKPVESGGVPCVD